MTAAQYAPASHDGEEWRPVVGWGHFYQVSSHGRVYSPRTQKFLKAGMNRRHRHVALCDGDSGKSFRVHKLVIEAFVGPCPPGMEVRHLDDDPDNNHVSNLVYGTRSQNMLDRVANGTHSNAKKTHCVHGHEFTPENTGPNAYGKGRRCLECKRIQGIEYMRRKRARHAALV